MGDMAIRVDHVYKRYHLGEREPYKSLRDVIARTASAPIDWLRKGQRPADNGLDYIWALDDVSFEIKQGEAVGIIGRNAAGKSTLLKILSRITKPTRGQAQICGRVGSLLEVGTGFHPELTGRENIYLNGAILGMKRQEIERKFDEIVAFAEIEKFLDTPVKRYSSGMYVRLAFAVASHLEPEILLVDEVLAVGDTEFQKKCLGKMDGVADEGRTVLFVSHNMGAVRDLCHRGILLSSGTIVADGEVNATIDTYLNLGDQSITPFVDLPEKAKNFYGEELGRGNRLSFCSIDGIGKGVFKLWEPWIIELDFEIYGPLKHVIAAVGLRTVQGVPLVTYWSEPRALMPGRYRAKYICNLPLKTCNLTAIVGLSEFERTFYYSENQGFVSVSDVSVTSQPFRSSGAGLFLSRDRVSIEYLGELSHAD